MGTITAMALAILAGGFHSARADEPPIRPAERALVSTHNAGVMYVNLQSGERSLTLYNAADPRPIDTRGAAALFDYWLSTDQNPCWDSPTAEGFGWTADATSDPTAGISQPVIGFDFGDLPFDSRIVGIVLSTSNLASEVVDSNADGVLDSGIDTVAVLYDALSERNRSSNAPPTAVVRIESIPGVKVLGSGLASLDVILDFGGEHFELGDSDGLNLGSLWMPGAQAGLDVHSTTTTALADGLADFQYLQFYTKHGSDDKVTSVSTFMSIAAPEGELVYQTRQTTTSTVVSSTTVTITITVTDTFLIPDPLPAARGVNEGFGIGTLGTNGSLSSLDWSVGGCCFWFGGLDCLGFLDQLQPDPPNNPTWHEFTPFAQQSLGLFSDSPAQATCLAIDFNHDGLLDNGDISAFIQVFFEGDHESDLNGDGITDNGDIGIFVQLFLACAG